jgi:hypothetical protein
VNDSQASSFGSRDERLAYNEAHSRRLNEKKAEWAREGFLVAGFRCECFQADCRDRIQLSSDDWKRVRSRPNRFGVVPGHHRADLETVVEEYPHFWIVEKEGRAGDVAEELA